MRIVEVGSGGQNATGNVLANDIDLDDAHSALSVTGVTGGTVGSAFATNYGHLTLLSTGGYTYVVDEGNPIVQARNADSPPLTETFTYTVSVVVSCPSETV